jgi:antirestriction protein ArdC
MTIKEKFKADSYLIADQIIEQIKKGAGKWEMPWHKGMPLALNRVTGSFYGGANLLLLWEKCKSKHYSKNYWATLKQWRKMGAMVKKGEKATWIVIVYYKQKAPSKSNNSLLYEEQDTEKTQSYLIARSVPVYNIDQVRGLYLNQPNLFEPKLSGLELINELVQKSGAKIIFGGDRAAYYPDKDIIQMPYKAQFNSNNPSLTEQAYYSTLLHELIHWTGHPDRCNRCAFLIRNSELYAFEELTAELGCAFLSHQFNQIVVPRIEHAKYIESWLKVLNRDFSYFYQAQNQALSAISWLLNKTNVFPLKLKPRKNHVISKEKLNNWEGILHPEEDILLNQKIELIIE